MNCWAREVFLCCMESRWKKKILTGRLFHPMLIAFIKIVLPKTKTNFAGRARSTIATNAAVIDLMLRGELDESVLVAFTGDEEKDSAGAIEIMQMLGRMECLVGKALVLDVTNEGWEDEAAFSIENDHGFDIITGYHIVELLQASGTSCVFVHEAEPDETWEYSKGSSSDLPGIPCLSLCLPVCGNMHGDDGVLLRKSSVIPYEDILRKLANAVF